MTSAHTSAQVAHIDPTTRGLWLGLLGVVVAYQGAGRVLDPAEVRPRLVLPDEVAERQRPPAPEVGHDERAIRDAASNAAAIAATRDAARKRQATATATTTAAPSPPCSGISAPA